MGGRGRLWYNMSMINIWTFLSAFVMSPNFFVSFVPPPNPNNSVCVCVRVCVYIHKTTTSKVIIQITFQT